MMKHPQIIFQLLQTNCLSVLDHFLGLVLKGLSITSVVTTPKIKRVQYDSIDKHLQAKLFHVIWKVWNFWEKSQQISWRILEIVESEEWRICDESDKFGLNKISQMEPDKLDWITLMHQSLFISLATL